jgi:hypothetical protein
MKKILEKFAHIIIPHEKNNNIPHILKAEFVLVLVLFVGILFYFNQYNFNIIRSLNLSATVYPAVLADLANRDRSISGVSELDWSPTLANAAKLKAEDMVKNGYFAHVSPSGVTPWYWLDEVNYDFSYAGENLAINFTESINVENAWLNSPKHKENILNSRFTEIGIATVDGVFEGRNTTFVVEFFGSPSKEKIVNENDINQDTLVNNNDNLLEPNVAGISLSNISKENNINIIEETNDFILVKNDSVVAGQDVSRDIYQNKYLSTWYERFIVNPTNTIRIIYTIILIFILVSVLLVLSKEYRKHHLKHLIIGTLVMVLVLSLIYIISI